MFPSRAPSPLCAACSTDPDGVPSAIPRRSRQASGRQARWELTETTSPVMYEL